MRTKARDYKKVQQKYEIIIDSAKKRKQEEAKKAKFVRCMMKDMAIERARRRLPDETEEEYLYYENRTGET